MSQDLKLAGVPVNAHREIVFGQTGGVDPVVVELEVTLERAERILAVSGYVPLTLNDEVMMQLMVLEPKPGYHPGTRLLICADRRWEWKYKRVVLDLNLRRRTGNAYIKGPRVEVFAQIDEVDYASHSLAGGVRTQKAKDLIERTLKQVVGTDFFIEAQLPAVDLEDVVINDSGNSGVAKALSYLPGVNVSITPDNRVRVYNDVYGAKLPERVYATGTFPQLSSKKRLRPKRVEVYFVEEAELRCDFIEIRTDQTTITASQELAKRQLNLVNVVKVNEPALTIPAGIYTADGIKRGSRVVGYGTWVTMDEYIAACIALPRPASALTMPITQFWIRKNWLQGFNLLRPVYCNSDGSPDVLWQNRLDTIHSSWRQTFRLGVLWRDALLGITNKRVAVYDPTTGTRAPSAPYCDYSVKPTWKGISRIDASGARQDIGWNITRHTASGGRINFTTDVENPANLPAPMEITIEDEEAFIFRLSPRQDYLGEAEKVAPGIIPIAFYMKQGVNEFNRTGGPAALLWEYAALADGWSMSFIISAVKGAPNGLGRYRKEDVKPEQAQKLLPAPIGTCEGPVLQLFVPMQVCTARYGWLDDASQQIRSSFYDGNPMPQRALVNQDHLRHVAEAMAARAYETFLDQPDGQDVRVPFDWKLQPVGTLKGVMHHLPPKGGLYTQLTYQEPSQMMDIWPLLPEGTRRFLQHTVVRK